ncbi:phosphonate metabolism protein/1,5-bisphosphokinase (PRPP-forming) PhnN [Thalassobius sp. S69A]|uniref:phosphonate metabolism protein/1,5-bisphosphokinase (PRPP-forming) PhnN n=1 Tax=unclassified Thalassovita TaxID=2619711 RepID=UPI003C7BD204
MGQGAIFAVVGPSGVGKDTLMAAALAARPDLYLVRRVITRPASAGGEDFEAVSPDEFARRAAAGAFVLHWQAHGLSYGIPRRAVLAAAQGRTVLFNGSRAMLTQAAQVFDDLRVLHIRATDAALAQRLQARGRETAESIAARLERARLPLPAGLKVVDIDNSGALDQAVTAFLAALDTETEGA